MSKLSDRVKAAREAVAESNANNDGRSGQILHDLRTNDPEAFDAFIGNATPNGTRNR
jgi:hypothetical protein